MIASKIPIWLFQKGFGHILINNPAQQGLHHHYLVKRLKELPFPMKSMTLLHILSFHEFSVRIFQGTYSLFISMQTFFLIQYSQVKYILALAPWSFKLWKYGKKVFTTQTFSLLKRQYLFKNLFLRKVNNIHLFLYLGFYITVIKIFNSKNFQLFFSH